MYYHGGEKGLKIFLVIMAVVIIMLFVSPAILFLQLINAQEQDTKRQLETEILILETENAQLREMLSIMQGERDKLQGELTRKIEQWLQQWDILEIDASAYAPYDNVSGACNDGTPNSTATGTVPTEGTFAVNPELIPYYSRMILIGDGWIEQGQALDTGGYLRQE